MMKFIVMLGLFALVASCGKQEEVLGPKGVGSRMTLSDTPELKVDEKEALSSICEKVMQKQTLFKNSYADKGVAFNFSSQFRGCSDRYNRKFTTDALVKYIDGKMMFSKLASGAKIFDDIVLRDFGALKEFCDEHVGKSLSNRYILSGNIAQVIYLEPRQTEVFIALETAYDFDGDNEFEIESKEQFLVINTNTEAAGIVRLRSLETKAGCDSSKNQSTSVLSVRLNKIKK